MNNSGKPVVLLSWKPHRVELSPSSSALKVPTESPAPTTAHCSTSRLCASRNSAVHNKMTTPYPSFDTPDDQQHPTPHPAPPSQLLAVSSLAQNSPLLEQPETDNSATTPQSHSNVRTMSPRVPRKRPAYTSKDEEYDGDFELEKTGMTPQSGAGRSQYSGVGSPGGSFRQRNLPPQNPNWNVDIEREDEPLSPRRVHQESDYEEQERAHKDKKSRARINGVDVSLYTTKKNVAQGMLDIALLSANCSQLKYLLFHYERDTSALTAVQPAAAGGMSGGGSGSMMTWFTSMDFYFIVNLICIGLSIGLQVIVGILLIMNGRHNIYVHRYQRVADSYSNLILCTVFIITIVNIFLSVFISAR